MMKYFSAVVLLSSLWVAPVVCAEDGKINFTGEITDVACNVSTDSSQMTVALGKVASTAFAGAGSTAAATAFKIKIEECPETVTQVAVKFDGASVPGDNSLLALSPGGASGVAIELTDTANQKVNLFESSPSYPVDASGTTTIDLVARYKATSSTVTVGSANAQALFTIIYP